MADTFEGYSSSLSSPIEHLLELDVGSDTLTFTTSRVLYVGTSGNVRVVTSGGDTVTLPNVAAGVFHSIRVTQVLETGSTALDIFVGW